MRSVAVSVNLWVRFDRIIRSSMRDAQSFVGRVEMIVKAYLPARVEVAPWEHIYLSFMISARRSWSPFVGRVESGCQDTFT